MRKISKSPLQKPVPQTNRIWGMVLCGVMEAEINVLCRETGFSGPVKILDPALHRNPDTLRTALQDAVDQLETESHPEAILLIFGLCSRGVEGVVAKKARLIMARAHDCITLLLGDRHAYGSIMKEQPNSYWYSPGWIKWLDMPSEAGLQQKREEWAGEYGEEDADYLLEVERKILQGKKAVFVDMGLLDSREDIAFTRDAAASLGWECEVVQGDPSLLRDLLSGNWDPDRFAVAEPGQSFHFTADDRILDPCAHCPLPPSS